MTSPRVSRDLSHMPMHVQMARVSAGSDVATATATAFLWDRGGEHYLVSNVHNLAGWDFLRSRAMSLSGALPTHIRFPVELSRRAPNGLIDSRRRTLSKPLQDTDGRHNWLVHPQHGSQVDVAVLYLGEISTRLVYPDLHTQGYSLGTKPVNTIPSWVDFEVDAGDDAYVIGYPRGLHGGFNYPIWKRASVASEPGLTIDGLPKILVDTASREGMSGSPVVAVRRGLTTPRGGTRGSELIGQTETFLGVYSGRLTDEDQFGAQLAVVWHGYLIDEIIAGGVRGALPWE